MDKVSGQSRRVSRLFAHIDPYDQRMLDVGDGHSVYVEQSGNDAGIPVVVFHGGPGGGCSPTMRRFFDPEIYRIIMFDQRGCGRSKPSGVVEANTTWHLLRDIEQIRETLGFGKFIAFGGSWGATLALLYAQKFPDQVRAMVLRGVFLMQRRELEWFYGGGAGHFWPEHWSRFVNLVPEDERDDLIGAYHKRLFSGDRAVEYRYSRVWSQWENALASFESDGVTGEPPAEYARIFARLECHYFHNNGFLNEQDDILKNMHKIAHIPGVIVQGRYDMICPPLSAYELSLAWPKARLQFVARAGHALSEKEISDELLRTMARISRY